MSIMKWTESLSVGVTEIDNQHKAIINIINKIYDCVVSNQGRENVEALLPELYWYASEHFKHEELYMYENSYSAVKEHKSKHESMLAKIQDVMKDFDNEFKNPNDLTEFLKDWLINHIMVEDMGYAREGAKIS